MVRIHLWVNTYRVPLFGSGLPHSVKCFLFPSICMQNSRYHCFLYSKVYMCHIFFIHSSIEGHLGCFQILAITNNAAMNIVEQMICSMIGHLLGIFPRLELLDPEVGWLPVSWETATLISTVAAQVYIPNNGWVFPSLHILSSIGYHWCFWV